MVLLNPNLKPRIMCSVVQAACQLLCENYRSLLDARLPPDCSDITTHIRDATNPPSWDQLDGRVQSVVVRIAYMSRVI